MTETTTPAPLRLVGPAYERGRQQASGRPGLAAQVRAAVAGRLQDVAAVRGAVSARELLREQTVFLRAHDGDGFEESRGIAEGFGIAHEELLAYLHANVLGDLGAAATGAVDGCTAWAAPRPGGGALVVKNRDYRGEHGLLQQVFVHEDRSPAAACPRILCVGSLGSPGAFSSGINAHGLAVADTQIATRDHGVGWLRYFLMTALLWRCRGVESALAFVRAVPHAGGGTLVLGDAAGRVAAVELGHRGGAVVESGPAWAARTNHFVDATLAASALRPADDLAASSAGRLQTVRNALAQWGGLAEAAPARALMSGHDGPGGQGGPCRHAAPGRAATLSCAVYDTARVALELSHGRPCDSAWSRHRLQDDGDAAVTRAPC